MDNVLTEFTQSSFRILFCPYDDQNIEIIWGKCEHNFKIIDTRK